LFTAKFGVKVDKGSLVNYYVTPRW
jgi:hypothetical protein